MSSGGIRLWNVADERKRGTQSEMSSDFEEHAISRSMNLLNKKYLVITVIGPHAGDDVSTIFSKKQKEIDNHGKTYWLLKSFRAKTNQIQNICKKANEDKEDVYCLFIEPSSKDGARPTICNSLVKYISHNGSEWEELPSNVNITGKIDIQSSALVLNGLLLVNPMQIVDLWEYSEFGTDAPLKLQLGASTICCVRKHSEGMKSRFRNVVALGRLAFPYAVLVK